jgi:hypothetical protein
MSLGYLLNATFLISDPEFLVFIFARRLSGSKLVILVGAANDQQTAKECKRGGR